jgi:hypothetical protein
MESGKYYAYLSKNLREITLMYSPTETFRTFYFNQNISAWKLSNFKEFLITVDVRG